MGMRTSQQAGNLLAAHYTQNMGGLNITDSPFAVGESQATGGYNYDYVKTGGFRKVRAPYQINASANAQLVSRGFNLLDTKAGVRSLIRAATDSFQLQDITAGSTTNLTEDTLAAPSTIFSGSGLAYSFMFTNPSSDTLWWASAALPTLCGVSSTTKFTRNGAAAPAGTISTSVSAGGGSFSATGTYYYAVALRKASTQALSNCALDVSATISNVTDKVTIDLSAITAFDTTKYDQIYIYRSSVGGSSGFTAGSLIAQVSSATTSYQDLGTSIASSQTVPRSGGTLDNSELPSGTYSTISVWKQRLVTSSSSTVYFSDVNKPESWPSTNTIVIPSGGKITAIQVVGYNHPGSGVTDEFLAVFKENELWLITGNDYTDWELKFIDYTGCIQQGLLANANGFLYWIDRRGVYVWDGVGKPVYASRPIEYLFSEDGDLNKNALNVGSADFFRPLNQVIWALSSNTVGQQQLLLKMDLRLTLPLMKNFLGEKIVEGVFTLGRLTNYCGALKAIQSPISGEQKDYLLLGDISGNTYKGFTTTTGTGNDVAFAYETAHLDQGRPSIDKRYHRVIAWVDKVGNWPITLDYWSNYRVTEADKSTVSQVISSDVTTATPIWDLGYWDVASWNESIPTLTPVVFNLAPGSSQNNNEGAAIKLRFSNATTGQPVVVNAYTIIYSEIGLRL